MSALLRAVKERTVSPRIFSSWGYGINERTLATEPILGETISVSPNTVSIAGVVDGRCDRWATFPRCDDSKLLGFVVSSYLKLRRKAIDEVLKNKDFEICGHVAGMFLREKRERFFLTYPICFFPTLVEHDVAHAVRVRLEEASDLIERLKWRT